MKDKQDFTGSLLMKISEAVVTINHEILIVELYAYGFSTKVLLNYLQVRW